MPVLFCVIPVFNEPETLEQCVQRVLATSLPSAWSLSIVLVDDASAVATRSAAERLSEAHRGSPGRLDVLTHLINRGKGAALRTGFRRVLERSADDADAVIIQDADLEYDPGDFASLLEALPPGGHGAVYGNRWLSMDGGTLVRRLHRGANRALTRISNFATGYRIGDMECCYKLLPVPLLRRVLPQLTEDRFGIEPQLTAVLAREGAEIAEVPVHYNPRGFAAGKKIGWRDGVRACWVMMRERFKGRPRHGGRVTKGDR
ncbi:MAG: glycosyltransferase family 2 protein [Phycisphaeraceae bacterium]|nr:glycosyltransferase family 2 protein [Phycisphaeraceae bacterium]